MAFLRGLAFILCWSLQGVLLVSNNHQKVEKRAARFGDDQDHGKKNYVKQISLFTISCTKDMSS